MSTPAQEQAEVPTIEEKVAAVNINGDSKEHENTDPATESKVAADTEAIKENHDESKAADPEKPVSEQKAATQPTSPIASSMREKPAGPVKTPFVDPSPTSKPNPTPELDATQQAKYNTVLEAVKAWKEIPAKDGKGGPLTDNEIMWLTRECILRYLRATKCKYTQFLITDTG